MHKTESDEKKAFQILDSFKQKLDQLEVDNEDFEEYENRFKQANAIYHTIYTRNMEKRQGKVEKLDREIAKLRDTLFNKKSKEVKITASYDKIETSNLHILKQREAFLKEKNNLEQELEGLSTLPVVTLAGLESIRDPKEIEIDLQKVEKSKDSKLKRSQELHMKLNKLKMEYEEISLRCELAQSSSANMSNSDKSSRVERRTRDLTSQITELEARLQEVEEEQSDYEGQAAKLIERLVEEDKQKRYAAESFDEGVANLRRVKTDLESKTRDLTNLRIDMADKKQRYQTLGTEMKNHLEELERRTKKLDISGYVRLLREAQFRGVDEGIYGLFVDLVEIPEEIHHFCETLILNKLFSVVVKDESVARRLLDLNKELKGGLINILPLSWAVQNDDLEHEYPDSSEVAILEREITPKPQYTGLGVDKLITQELGGYVCVQTLAEAQEYASNHHVTCCTARDEVVYSGAFLSRLGYSNSSSEVLEKYIKFEALNKEYMVLKSVIESFSEQHSSLKDQELASMKEVEQFESEKGVSEQEVLRFTYNENDIKRALIQLKKTLYSNRVLIDELSSQKQAITSQIKVLKGQGNQPKLSASQLKKLNSQREELSNQLSDQAGLIKETELWIGKASNSIENLQEELRQAWEASCQLKVCQSEKSLYQSISKDRSLLKGKVEIALKKLDTQSVQLNSELKSNNAELSRVIGEKEKSKRLLSQSQKDLYELNQKRLDIQRQIDKFAAKIKSNEVSDQLISNYSSFSDKKLLASLSQILKSNKGKYTEKDRLNFEKLDEHFSSYNKFSSIFKEVQNEKGEFYDLVGKSIF